jgi:hypothetical protein
MKLIYKQITRLNQYYWYWTDGFTFKTLEMSNLDDALYYGLNNGYINKIPMYPEYESLFA